MARQISAALPYVAVFVVVGSNIVLGTDWRVTSNTLPPKESVKSEATVLPVASTKEIAPTVPLVSNKAENTAINVADPPVHQPIQPNCDITACSVAYRSFRELDCTYQPNNGPRRLCTKGKEHSQFKALYNVKGTSEAYASAGARGQCSVPACTAAYRSFNASDCTYQPSSGPRRLCTKLR